MDKELLVPHSNQTVNIKPMANVWPFNVADVVLRFDAAVVATNGVLLLLLYVKREPSVVMPPLQ